MCAHTHTLTHSVSTLGNPAQRQSFLKFVSNMFSESESEVAQLCPTLCDPMDCSPPGSSVHGIFQARVLEWVAISFSRGIFLTQGSNPGLLHCRQMFYHLSYQGNMFSSNIKNRYFIGLPWWLSGEESTC